MEQQYVQNISSVDELIPDISQIISEYTGGVCDAITQEGSQCWYNHDNCDHYCFETLDNWLYKIIEQVENSDTSILLQNKNNVDDDVKIIKLPIDYKYLYLNFKSQSLVEYLMLYHEFIGDYDEKMVLFINFKSKMNSVNLLPQRSTLLKEIEIIKNDVYSYQISWTTKHENRYFIIQWVYHNILIPILQHIKENSNDKNNLILSAKYLQENINNYVSSNQLYKFIKNNQLNIPHLIFGVVQNYLVGINSIIPVGYAQWEIYNESNQSVNIIVSSTSEFII